MKTMTYEAMASEVDARRDAVLLLHDALVEHSAYQIYIRSFIYRSIDRIHWEIRALLYIMDAVRKGQI